MRFGHAAAPSVASVVEPRHLQLAGWALAGLLVVVLGARYIGGGASASAPAVARTPAPSASVRRAAPARVVIDLSGAVARPGVYELHDGDRVRDAVRRAGGLTPKALPGGANLAAKLVDGSQVLIPERASVAAAGVAAAPAGATAAPWAPVAPVSLNTATAEQLDALDGIGPTMAQKIVEYRAQHGGFGSLHDLDAIPGIGPKRIAALKGKVTM